MNLTTATIDEEAAWEAVLARDVTRDGSFICAVRTTGIYCRPSCPSRHPRRKNVRFFPSAAAARASGYRACKRCRPDTEFVAEAEPFVVDAIAFLEANADERVTLDQLARVVGKSAGRLQRRFKATTGWTPKELHTAIRLARFRRHAKETGDVAASTYAAGFGSSRGLYDAAKDGLGMSPAAAAQGGRGTEVAVSITACSLGLALIASSARGVCSVLLGDDEDALRAEFAKAFPHATHGEGHSRHARLVRDVVRHIDHTTAPLALPVDLAGTPFQLRVWHALRDIPAGETRSYGAMAAEIGAPDAARAVARACASNVIAVLVPCHRVVRADGATGGYRWGANRKAALLERESPTR